MARKQTKKKSRPVKKSPRRSVGPSQRESASESVPVVGIGASAGGLEAFQQLLRSLPTDTGMGFVLVQHLAPQHESLLTELLARATKMPVQEVTDGVRIRSNHMYVIPPDAEMTISNGVLHLSARSPDRRRMPIDSFLRSLAEDCQGRAIGIVLSGTASDGTLGLQAIKAMGGVTFAQDEKSAKYGGMPRSAIATGDVDFVLPPEEIASELARVAAHFRLIAPGELTTADRDGGADGAFNRILSVLKNFSHVDFSQYKQGTIRRRITRRMFLLKAESLDSYLQALRKDPHEVEALFNDMLINVTEFFRDSDAFDALVATAFPMLMKGRTSKSPLRIWVPGCSTGEEAYSLTIAMLEYLGDEATNTQMQVFATDVSELIIQKARSGIYPLSIAMDLTPDRLRRYFHRVDGGYRISKTIRDVCIFAKQDVAKDPPFSKLDLISCRNVMIYMGPELQKRVVRLFHYALNREGVLFLGSSETAGSFTDLFSPMDKKHRIYSKRDVAPVPQMEFSPRARHDSGLPEPVASSPVLDLQKAADQLLLNRYAPASVIVRDNLEVVQFIGETGKFLQPAPGAASLNLLKIVKPGLHLELRLAFQRVRRGGTIRKEGIIVEAENGFQVVNFEIMPLKGLPAAEHYYMVVFENGNDQAAGKEARKSIKSSTKAGTKDAQRDRVQAELEATREYLQSIIEEQRTTNEELRSANEEIQSSNEELQSINEELETAKEELQSTNEELTTLNEELQNRNEELSHVNNDLNNLLSSVNIPIIMLSSDLRVRRFTPVSERVMNLIPSDVGRPLAAIKPKLKGQDLNKIISRVTETLETSETEIEDQDGKWYSMRVRPYRTVDNRIDGVTIVFLDFNKTRGAHKK